MKCTQHEMTIFYTIKRDNGEELERGMHCYNCGMTEKQILVKEPPINGR